MRNERAESIENVKDFEGRTIELGQKVVFASGGWKRRSRLRTGFVQRIFWSWTAKKFYVSVGIPTDDSWRQKHVTEKKFSLFCVRDPLRIFIVSP